jgi:hypothetical protein
MAAEQLVTTGQIAAGLHISRQMMADQLSRQAGFPETAEESPQGRWFSRT